MFCEKCGAEMVEGAAFCYKCGAPAHVEETEKTEAPKPAEPEAKPARTVPQPTPQAAQEKPQQPAPAPQQQYQQNTYYNTQSGYYQQTASYNPVDSTISTARTLGILAIVGACTITLGGLICGIIGLLKVKDLQVPPQLEAAKRSAKKLNMIGIFLAIGFMILAFILVGIAGCSAYSYY